MSKLVYGVGINDADYPVQPWVSGKKVFCKYYSAWQNMLERCYSKRFYSKNKTYVGCSVCKEWLTFSNFKAWMERQDWHGKQLDKDILIVGNKEYSPLSCAFVSKQVNTFVCESNASRGVYLIGVDWMKAKGKFRSRCCNPFNNKNEHVGLYDNEIDAHLAWRLRKRKHAYALADLQEDSRIACALRARYA